MDTVPDTADELLEQWNLPSGDVIHLLMQANFRPTTMTPVPLEDQAGWDDPDYGPLIMPRYQPWRWLACRRLAWKYRGGF